jgi:Mg-chelatase subunit ChlD
MTRATLYDVKELFANFLPSLPKEDTKGLITFDSRPHLAAPLNSDVDNTIIQLKSLEPGGGRAVYDAIREATDHLMASQNTAYRLSIVLLTTGEDKNSTIAADKLVEYVKARTASQPIAITIIALDKGGQNFPELEKIAEKTRGAFRRVPLTELRQALETVFAQL